MCDYVGVGSGGGMAMVPSAQPRTGLDASGATSGLTSSNLETIIAATVRAVTGQLTGMDASANGAVMNRSANPSALPGMDMSSSVSGAYGMSRWPGQGADGGWGGVDTGRRPGATGMPSADAVRSGLLSSDSDPNTLYVGNVRQHFMINYRTYFKYYS